MCVCLCVELVGITGVCLYHVHTSCTHTDSYNRISSAVKHPKELVVTVELAGVETVADVELEVFERRLELVSQNPVYKLEVCFLCGCGGCVMVVVGVWRGWWTCGEGGGCVMGVVGVWWVLLGECSDSVV